MSKQDLINSIATEADLPKSTVDKVLIALAKTTAQELQAGNEVVITDIVKLSVVNRAERSGHNPRTGEKITVPAHKKVVAKPRGALSTLFK